MKFLKSLLLLFIGSFACAAGGTHVLQGDQFTGSSITITGTGIKFADGTVQITSAPVSGGGGGGVAVTDGRVFCPPELSPCGMASSGNGGIYTLSSATLHCEGFTGGVPGSSSISISSVTFFASGAADHLAVGFYNSAGTLVAQTTGVSVAGETTYTTTGAPIVLTTGSRYYRCFAANTTTGVFYQTAGDYAVSMQDGGASSSNYNLFDGGNASTCNSSGNVVLPASFGTRGLPNGTVSYILGAVMK